VLRAHHRSRVPHRPNRKSFVQHAAQQSLSPPSHESFPGMSSSRKLLIFGSIGGTPPPPPPSLPRRLVSRDWRLPLFSLPVTSPYVSWGVPKGPKVDIAQVRSSPPLRR
jgi:hypothetical protein